MESFGKTPDASVYGQYIVAGAFPSRSVGRSRSISREQKELSFIYAGSLQATIEFPSDCEAVSRLPIPKLFP